MRSSPCASTAPFGLARHSHRPASFPVYNLTHAAWASCNFCSLPVGCEKQNLRRALRELGRGPGTSSAASPSLHWQVGPSPTPGQGRKEALQVSPGLTPRVGPCRQDAVAGQEDPSAAPAPRPPLLCGRGSVGACSTRDSQPGQTWALQIPAAAAPVEKYTPPPRNWRLRRWDYIWGFFLC